MSKPSKNNPVTTKGIPLPVFPIGDRVVVERLGEEEVKTQGGLILPSVAADKTAFGVILAAGPEAHDVLYSVGIEIGDNIVFGKFAPEVMRWQTDGLGRQEVYFINVKDVWGCVELAERIRTGEYAIEQTKDEDGHPSGQFRFFKASTKLELEETDDGHFRAADNPDEEAEAEVIVRRRRHKQLQEQASVAHMRQDLETMEHLQAQMLEEKKAIKALGGEI